MIFVDESNFFKTIKFIKNERKQDRVIDYNNISKFVINFLQNNSQYTNKNLSHVRTYLYDGEYTDILLNKMKKELENIPDGDGKNWLTNEFDKANKGSLGQKEKLKRMSNYRFFEVRLKPLQFSKRQGVFQKGVDVQLAVDLVSNAYLNNYDIAVLFSGDIDLLESIKLVKHLGKHVIIFSHWEKIAKGMRKFTDLFIDLKKLNETHLDKFTHIFQKKERGNF